LPAGGYWLRPAAKVERPRATNREQIMQVLKFVIAAAAAVGIIASASAQHAPLVTTEWVEKNINDPKVRIVEVSVEPGSSNAVIFRARRTSCGIPISWTP
jgi:hypothetical protein